MYRAFFIYGFGPFAAVMLTMGYVMSGGGTVADIHEANACKGFVVFNGEQIPKCGGIPK